ncbi:TetR/AcrR family transcriptional regulator [Marivivens aquimaris]|uniref:TetR/AcrR family transcriptional regulator n=1 Tax=Marivivens aquimaris TaxID=2774876 RepID=UPI001882CC2B|nr:TetR/AcrR family transcriptional regulator [Marivivens aquimaris]
MHQEKQAERRIQIETAAYGLLALKGYKATSMLEVAKRAKASNETLYKWYGNKQGLFLSMVERNAETSLEQLQSALTEDASLRDILLAFGPELLNTLTGQRAVVLNRAAAGDVHDTGMLGRTLADAGRASIIPLLTKIFGRFIEDGAPEEAAEIYYDLLIGDLQIRRVIGSVPLLKDEEIDSRSRRATDLTLRLIGQA